MFMTSLFLKLTDCERRFKAWSLCCRPPPGQNRDWFGQIQLIHSVELPGHSTEALCIKWLEEKPDTDSISADIKMPWLTWERRPVQQGRRGTQRNLEQVYNLVSISSLDGPAYIMPDSTNGAHFFYNKYVCEWDRNLQDSYCTVSAGRAERTERVLQEMHCLSSDSFSCWSKVRMCHTMTIETE